MKEIIIFLNRKIINLRRITHCSGIICSGIICIVIRDKSKRKSIANETYYYHRFDSKLLQKNNLYQQKLYYKQKRVEMIISPGNKW